MVPRRAAPTAPLVSLCVSLSLAALVSAPGAALAADDKASVAPVPTDGGLSVEGTVIAIDQEELVLDLGASRGAAVGQKLELWRPLRVKHPVTGAMLLDRFAIGTLTIVQVRPKTAIARVTGKPLRAPATGDIVVVELPKPEPTAPTPTPSPIPTPTPALPPSGPAPSPGAAADVEGLADLEATLARLVRQPPEARIAAYEAFARAHPTSPLARVVAEDARELRRAALAQEAARAAATAPRAGAPAPSVLSFDAPREARAGAPLSIALELGPRFAGGVVHYRAVGAGGAGTYATAPMRPMGARYFGAALPPAAVQAPGVEYFVEGVDDKGIPTEIVGEAAAPRRVTVGSDAATDAALGAKGERGFGVSVLTDYASFDVRKNHDTLWQTEGSFTLRLRDVGLRAIRSGAGVYRGKGGTLEELDDKGLAPRDIGLTYGHVEAEYAFASNYAAIGRAIVGLREPGIGGGAQGFVRFGNDRRTNLLVGGEILGGIGLRGIAQLELRTIPRVPIALRTEVTNQPAGVSRTLADQPLVASGQAEVGARAIGQVGFEIGGGLAVAARVSYQGRTINHAGPGAGAAVSYEW